MTEQLELIPPTPRPLTARQQQVLDFIADYIDEHHYPPSTNDIARHFSFKSNAAWEHLKALVRKGAILKTPGVIRGISLPKKPNA